MCPLFTSSLNHSTYLVSTLPHSVACGATRNSVQRGMSRRRRNSLFGLNPIHPTSNRLSTEVSDSDPAGWWHDVAHPSYDGKAHEMDMWWRWTVYQQPRSLTATAVTDHSTGDAVVTATSLLGGAVGGVLQWSYSRGGLAHAKSSAGLAAVAAIPAAAIGVWLWDSVGRLTLTRRFPTGSTGRLLTGSRSGVRAGLSGSIAWPRSGGTRRRMRR